MLYYHNSKPCYNYDYDIFSSNFPQHSNTANMTSLGLMRWKKESSGMAKVMGSDFCFESKGDNSEGKKGWKQLAHRGKGMLLQ